MQKIVVNREVQVKCDICGKEETFNEHPLKSMDPVDYGWSEVEFTVRSLLGGRKILRYNLCPICRQKFMKLVSEVNLEE